MIVEKKGTSWIWIVVWLIIFWPIGLFLLFRKLATDRSALMSGKTWVLSTIGWVLVLFGVVGFSVEMNEGYDPVGVVLAFIFLTGGVLLLRKAWKTKKTATRYKKYINIVVNQGVRSIDNIAGAVAVSYDVAVKDLQHMIDSGYLKGAYIHQGNREIVLQQVESVIMQAQTAPLGQIAVQMKTVSCRGCGANNAVAVGSATECEYCGTQVSA